jgi:uncharacterized protein YggE
MRRTLVLALLSVSAFAQVAADGITASASKTVTLWPDGAVFTVNVTSPGAATVEEAAASLKDTGITASHLVAAASTEEYDYTLQPPAPVMRMVHAFQITVPYPKAKEMTEKLRAAGGSVTYSLSLTASDEAVQLARQRVLPELVAEIKRRAESLAEAGGLTLGTIQAITESASPAAAIAAIASPIDRFALGTRSPGLQATFSVAAKFSVSR